jgi:hypothetical protein
MALPKSVTMEKDGGFYYRAMVFRYLITYIILLPVLVLILVALLNPLWFRDDFFRWVENTVNRFARWRNYNQYRIYLGTDPEMWHTLKDGSTNYGEAEQSASVQASP